MSGLCKSGLMESRKCLYIWFLLIKLNSCCFYGHFHIIFGNNVELLLLPPESFKTKSKSSIKPWLWSSLAFLINPRLLHPFIKRDRGCSCIWGEITTYCNLLQRWTLRLVDWFWKIGGLNKSGLILNLRFCESSLEIYTA